MKGKWIMYMSRVKLRSFILVTLAVTALCVVTAPSASATTTDWYIGGTALSGTATLATTASVSESFKLKTLSVTVECTGSTISSSSAEIQAPNKMMAASLTFNGCSASSPCTLATTSITTVPVSAELTEQTHPEDRALFSPKTKTTFATIRFEGAMCALEGTQPLTGKVAAKFLTGELEKETQELNINALGSELKLAGLEATLKGKANLKLGGTSAGTNWLFGGCGGGLTTPANASAKAGEEVSIAIENQNCTWTITVDKGEVLPGNGPFEFASGVECINTKVYEPRGNTVCTVKVKAKGTAMTGELAKFRVETTGGEKKETTLKVL